MTSVTVDGTTYCDDNSCANTMLGKGYATHFFPLLADVLTRVEDAETAATNAAAYSAGWTGTSTTSIATGSGSKTFTTQSGKLWVTGTKILVARTSAPTTTWMYGEVTSYSSTSLVVSVSDYLGSGTYTDWTITLSGIKGATGTSGATAPRLAITGATTLGASDKGKRVVATSGTFTLGFSAASVLTSGWYAWIQNAGTGLVTVDPNSTEQIDGVTSFVMYPSECRFVYCDGSALYSVLEKPFDYTWTASGSLVVPPGYRAVGSYLVGGGSGAQCGARAASSPANGGSGGAGGGCGSIIFDVTPGETITITVGAGGAGAIGRSTDGAATDGTDGGGTELLSGSDRIALAAGGNNATGGTGMGANYLGAGLRGRRIHGDLRAQADTGAIDGGNAGAGDANAGADGVSSGTSGFGLGGAGGGAGGGVTTGTAYAGGAGGLLSATSSGGGGAAGTAGGGAGGTATNAAGGGGGSSVSGAGGAGGNGSTYGHGGGGGGAVVGAYTSGAGGNGADGMARLWGVI